jgi:hypothetical protein
MLEEVLEEKRGEIIKEWINSRMDRRAIKLHL